MVVFTFSRLPPQTSLPLRAAAALPRPARHIHRLIQIRSPPSRPPAVLSFAPIRRAPCSSDQENGGASEILEEKDAEEISGKKKESEEQAATETRENSSSLAPAPDLWVGFVEEVKEIEWPAFGSVLGTTGVVLAVIAGSSIVLLTVNLIFAEISDRIFVGRGLQDFFG